MASSADAPGAASGGPVEVHPGAAPPGPGEGGPYRTLWVPLLVVPFLVVGVLVLVYLFFGAIRGREATPEENLRRVTTGGDNESKQAAMSLVSQVLENLNAELRGEPPPWPVGPDFLARVQEAWKSRESDSDANLRLALAALAVECGDPQGFEKLASILRLPDEADPDGKVRVNAMLFLSSRADPRAKDEVIPFLRHPDPLLRQAAAGVLQRLPGADTVAALEGLLGDPALELRGQAAISLSKLGSPSGAEVLVEMLDPESYAAANRGDPRKYASASRIQESRLKAVEALARLGRGEDRPRMQALAGGDEDPLVREAAMRALAQAPPR